MSHAPRVTVGLPVYNGEDYVAEAIESVLAQTFSELELVISDNASTDGTEDVCRRYERSDSRVRYVRHPANRGAAANYNACFHLSRAEPYFKWISHDDVIAPPFLERCIAALEAEPGAAVAFPATVYVDADGHETAKQVAADLSVRGVDPGARALRLVRLERTDLADVCFSLFGVMRKDVARRTELHGSCIAGDQVTVFQLALEGPLIQIPDALYIRRLHPENSMAANRTPEQRAKWFDARASSGTYYQHWRLFGEHYRSVRRVSLPPATRFRAYAAVTRRCLAEWRNLAGDVRLAGLRALRSP